MRQAEKEEREFKRALKGVEAEQALIEPSQDELRNGWTAETLTSYIAEQSAAQSLRINPGSAMRRQPVTHCRNKYSPTKHWRR